MKSPNIDEQPLKTRAMGRAAIEGFFAQLAAQNPNPTTELVFGSNFQLLAAVLLSAQATDASVNRATAPLFAVAPTPQAMLALGEQALEGYLRSLNYYKAKTRHLLQTCHILVEQYGGEIPRTREQLQALPGVGRKTANVVLNTAFGEPTMAVDTHIFRVARRTGLAAGDNPLAVELALLKRVPKPYLQNAHHWLILLGRYICTARAPKCQTCPVLDYCNFKDKIPKNPKAAKSAKTVKITPAREA